MKSIYNLIKEEIINHPKVLNSVLGSIATWKRSNYIILSDLITEELQTSEELQGDKKFELGNSISHVTLQRFFESDYDDKTHNDLRFIKTLDKICIFLGFKDLNSYVLFVKNNRNPYNEDTSFFDADIIYKYCNANFTFFKGFPERDFSLFKDLIFEESPFFTRITDFSKELCDKKYLLVTDNNRSSFDIFDVQIIADDEERKVLKTQEFWNLVFNVVSTGEEIKVHELNSQTYFVRKINNQWKIWDNHNPNTGLLNKK